MKILELFGGIGACSKALKNLGINYKIADYVEIDKYAVKSFNAMHGTNFEPQDICQWNKDMDVDLVMHGSPCQDFSLAGLQAGGDENSGTRSSLMYETVRIVDSLKPKYVIWENVKNVLSAKHKHNFDAYLEKMDSLGYKNYYQVLNAKDYGTPQNRERVFVVSIRTDIDTNSFEFPKPVELKVKLKDLLDTNVDEKWYLTEEQVERIKSSSYHQNQRRIQEKDWCDTLCARDWKDPKCIQVGKLTHETNAHNETIIYDDYNSRIRKDQDTIGTLTCNIGSSTPRNSYKLIECNNDLRVRKLTPKEAFRLMGFDDEDFEKAAKVNSNTQLYKQAGNSICVSVLEAIFKQLLGGKN